jgi:hypothetical protein
MAAHKELAGRAAGLFSRRLRAFPIKLLVGLIL